MIREIVRILFHAIRMFAKIWGSRGDATSVCRSKFSKWQRHHGAKQEIIKRSRLEEEVSSVNCQMVSISTVRAPLYLFKFYILISNSFKTRSNVSLYEYLCLCNIHACFKFKLCTLNASILCLHCHNNFLNEHSIQTHVLTHERERYVNVFPSVPLTTRFHLRNRRVARPAYLAYLFLRTGQVFL